MKNNLFLIFLFTAITFNLTAIEARHDSKDDHKGHSHQHMEESKKSNAVIPTHNRLIKVKVDGIVCSFCAYGAEKKLSKLPFVEKKSFGGDGVLVDLKSGFVTVTLKENKKVNFGKIITAITKGGYVAREIHLTLNGSIKKQKKTTVIADPNFPYIFKLEKSPKHLKNPVNVYFEVPKKYKDKQEIQVMLVKINGKSKNQN